MERTLAVTALNGAFLGRRTYDVPLEMSRHHGRLNPRSLSPMPSSRAKRAGRLQSKWSRMYQLPALSTRERVFETRTETVCEDEAAQLGLFVVSKQHLAFTV